MSTVDTEADTRDAPAGDLPQRLNLGCGDDYRQDAHNVDVSEQVTADTHHDLNDYPWPFPTSHFQHVTAQHVLEHLTDPQRALKEITRILTPSGTLRLVYPIGHTRFEDPTHRQYWTVQTAHVIAGDRAHPHEVDVPLALTDYSVDWQVGHAEPLVRWYVRYRRLVAGDGPWLEQIPGVYGEVTATYHHTGGES